MIIIGNSKALIVSGSDSVGGRHGGPSDSVLSLAVAEGCGLGFRLGRGSGFRLGCGSGFGLSCWSGLWVSWLGRWLVRLLVRFLVRLWVEVSGQVVGGW